MSFRGKLECYLHLGLTLAAALPCIAYRCTVSLITDPEGSQKFLHQALNARDLEADDPVLGSVEAVNLIKSDCEPRIIGPYHRCRTGGTHNLLELASLAYFMRVMQPRVVFEIGTFVGQTTRLLALNTPEAAKIFTLDLPQEEVAHQVGEAFREKPEGRKITQLYGDTQTFDYTPWYNQCDFVWVDACHDYPYVVQDTQAALKLRRPVGWIAWHDYRHTAWWSGVTRAVRELAPAHPGLCHLRGTTIAVLPPESQELSNKYDTTG